MIKILNFLISILIAGVFMSGIGNAYLSVEGNKVIGSDSNAITLKGFAVDNGLFSKWDSKKEEMVMIEDSDEVEWSLKEDDVEKIRGLGANVVRYCINIERFSYDNPNRDKNFKIFERHLKWLKKNHIYVIVNLHVPPGYTNTIRGTEDSIFESKDNWDKFVGFWKEFIGRYKKEKWIAGWELFNEPQIPEGMTNATWNDKVGKLLKDLRTIDRNHIFFISNPEAKVINRDQNGLHHVDWNFIPLVKYDDPNIVYVFHFYHPTLFTQQGVFSDIMGVEFPFEEIKNQKWISNSEARFQKEENGWFYFATEAVSPPSGADTVFGSPYFSVSRGEGKLYADDMKLYEIDPAGNRKELPLPNRSFKPELPDFLKDKDPWWNFYNREKYLYWYTYFPDKYETPRDKALDPVYIYETTHGFADAYSVSISNLYFQYANWMPLPSQFYIKPLPGYKYQIEGWLSDKDRAHIGISWSSGDLVVHDKEELAKLIFERYVLFAEENNVPLFCTEFGSSGFADIKSRVKWTKDMLEIFDQNGISYTYWDYNGSWAWGFNFGLYLKDTFDLNQSFHQYDPLIDALKSDFK